MTTRYYQVILEIKDEYCPSNDGIYSIILVSFGPHSIGQLREAARDSMKHDDYSRTARVRKMRPLDSCQGHWDVEHYGYKTKERYQ